jgi:hypothetical protein
MAQHQSSPGATVRAVSNFGKPDATGRSSGKLERAERKLLGPPAGEPWAWLTAELLASEAWRGMSRACHRLIVYLMREHCLHAGRENGRLQAPYAELVRFGLSRRFIHRAIAQSHRCHHVEQLSRFWAYGAGGASERSPRPAQRASAAAIPGDAEAAAKNSSDRSRCGIDQHRRLSD